MGDTKVVSWAQTTSLQASTGTTTSVPWASIAHSGFGRRRGKRRRRWMRRLSCEKRVIGKSFALSQGSRGSKEVGKKTILACARVVRSPGVDRAVHLRLFVSCEARSRIGG